MNSANKNETFEEENRLVKKIFRTGMNSAKTDLAERSAFLPINIISLIMKFYSTGGDFCDRKKAYTY